MCCSPYYLAIGAVMAGLGVTFGAFGAHGVEEFCAQKYTGTKTVAGQELALSYKRTDDFKTGARYHMYQAFGLIIVGLLARHRSSRALHIAAWSFLAGIVLFSGSLYVLALTGQTAWGMVAPFGGFLMIVAWFTLAIGARPKAE